MPSELAWALTSDPVRQFAAWLSEAEAVGVPLAGAFALATADPAGTPSVRMLLLRGFDVDGLRFFTNRASRKGRELAANPRAAAVFHWAPLDRQVRLAGTVTSLSDEESAAYWATRPRGSQLAAWASHQGTELDSTATLDARVAELASRYEGTDVPLPPFWGGYLLAPDIIEFWESRPDRLHHRVEFRRSGSRWKAHLLQP
ncbi:MAG: pyridoxamine 5'-phosphate oxidase [Chloroflexota bacterium]|nr:pyridoxamine 5'-phosphate oxidase [Chloroflexota bacterium]